MSSTLVYLNAVIITIEKHTMILVPITDELKDFFKRKDSREKVNKYACRVTEK